jgi:microcystin degradation protein MlrC
MIERGITDAALGPLWDPGAVRIAFEAGVGARLPMRLGGKVSPLSGDPLDALCTVKALARSMTMSGLAGTRWRWATAPSSRRRASRWC